MRTTIAVILAAGKSTRMHSSFSKVLHKIYGKPMLSYVVDTIKALHITKNIIVTSNKSEIEKNCAFDRNVEFVTQKKLLGTGHALSQTKKVLSKFDGDLLVLYGDMPLLTSHTLKRLLDKHKGSLAACTLLTAILKDPTGYGRIIRNADDRIVNIVEEQDASIYEKAIEEVNVGVYYFRAKELFSAIEDLTADNKKGEYYLTDTIRLLAKKDFGIESLQADDAEETIGVNSRHDLATAQQIARNRILDMMMANGVGIIDPSTTHIYNDVEIGQDTVIYPFTVIESNVKIGQRCKIGPFSRIKNYTQIKDEVEIVSFTEVGGRSIPSRSVVSGTPAKIRKRSKRRT